MRVEEPRPRRLMWRSRLTIRPVARPIEGDDVTLRRAIGAKKDEFFVQRRRHESARSRGCSRTRDSRANPYYIVQQGKVSAFVWLGDEGFD